MSRENKVEDQEKAEEEAIVARVREEMAKIFPDYKTLDRSRWDGYKPEEDEADNGRLLTFYLGEAEPSNPNIMFIFKKAGGFAVNFYNNPSFEDSETCICLRGSTVYKEPYLGDGKLWAPDELEEACDQTRIWMEGLPLKKEILSQTILDSQHRLVSLGDWLKEVLEYKSAHKTKDQDKELLALPNVFQFAEESPRMAKKLVMSHLESDFDREFKIGGKSYDFAKILGEIFVGTELGEEALNLEIARIGIYYELLWQSGVARPGKSPNLKLPD